MDQRDQAIQAQFLDGAVRMVRSERFGHEVGSQYVDLFWTPILGPGVLALLRWARWRIPTGHEVVIPATEICEALGRMAPAKACQIVARAVQFHAADLIEAPGGFTISLRSALNELSDQRVEQLSGGLRTAHDALVGAR